MNLKLHLHTIFFTLFFLNFNYSRIYSQCVVNSTETWNSFPACGPDNGITVESGGHLTINFALSDIFGGGITVKDGGVLIINNDINNIIDGVSVKNGGELTVNNSTITIPGSQTGIIISQGGKLFLDGATVIFNGGSSNARANVGIECIGAYSTGLDGNGNIIHIPLDEQFDVFPDPNVLNDNSKWEGTLNPDQSLVVVKASTIRFGEWGVKSTYGGIIRVSEGSSIEDCHVAIDIGTWHSASYPQTNASYFMNSTFSWGQAYHSNNNFLMRFNNVNGMNIGGCTLTTTYTGAQCNRGTGIFSYLSTYAVSQGGNSFCEGTTAQINANVTPQCLTNCMLSGPTNGCVFENLDTAISFTGDQNNMDNGTLNVRFSRFKNNLLGIVAKYGRNFRIDNNKFDGDAFNMNDNSGTSIFGFCIAAGYPKIDILLYESTGFKIYKNEFEFNGDVTVGGNQTPVNHILIDGFDPFSSTIKWNKFKSFITTNVNTSIVSGITIDGLNPHLLILCNEFTDMGIDILVKGSSSIHGDQENPTDLNAFNKFSALLTNRERLNNTASGSFINYTYDGVLGSIYDPFNLGVTRINPLVMPAETPDCRIADCEGYLVKIKVLNMEKGTIKLYPNPASNKINISSNAIQMNLVKKVEIYNLEGKLILTKFFSDSETEYSIDLTNFLTGLYVLKLVDVNNLSYSQKFMIE